MNRIRTSLLLVVVPLLIFQSHITAQDWTRFRGPDGLGVSKDKNVPSTWSETENLLWKAKLPGPGASSPIVVGSKVFVTSYSGSARAMKRQLTCFDKKSGKEIWQKSIDAVQPEDSYSGYLREHGYASNTPTSDGEMIFAFFGKSGVFAFDMEGNQKWKFDVGQQSSNRRWGSAASLVMYKDLLIVNAGEEGRAIFAIDKKTGEQKWKAPGAALELAYGTPVVAKLTDGSEELLISAVGELWSIFPETGKLKAYKSLNLTGNITPSIVFKNDVAYTFGGYPSTVGQAIKVGGTKVLPESDVVWSTRIGSYVPTPLLYENHLYWVTDRGQAICLKADSADKVYQERLRGLKTGGRPFYASPVYADGKIIVPSRKSGIFVFAAKPEFEQIAVNQFDDDSEFNGTIAISESKLYIRSNEYLYCVGKK